jgi:hypothetical protein
MPRSILISRSPKKFMPLKFPNEKVVNIPNFVAFDVLTAVVMKSLSSGNMCDSPLKVNWRLGGTRHFLLQVSKNKPDNKPGYNINQVESNFSHVRYPSVHFILFQLIALTCVAWKKVLWSSSICNNSDLYVSHISGYWMRYYMTVFSVDSR